MIKGIGHTAFNVKDMEKSIKFYEKTLGFIKAFDIYNDKDEPWIVYMYAGGTQFVELFYGATNDVAYSDKNAGFFHLCLEVDDINEAWKRIVDTGAPQDDAPKQGGDGNWQCWTHDPDGVKLELMQIGETSLQMDFIKSLRG
ncbi:MAG: VOC family protein [Clostridia bacterium]|nr:VOC family protein [Clostridia bacterium]